MGNTIIGSVYEQHRDVLLGQLVALTRDRQAAEDLLQESYVRLLTEASAGRMPDNPRAWLARVGYNLVVNRARRNQAASRFAECLRTTAAQQSPEEELICQEAEQELLDLLSSLKGIDRVALVMVAQGYSGSEIARAVGRSEGALRTRLCRARSQLRERKVAR